MDAHGNEFQVLSLTSPGPQAETDPIKVYMSGWSADGRGRNSLG
jgi:hypothetical protein